MRAIWKQMRKENDRGTSLVEVVVAVFILGFVGLSLAGGLSSTNKITDKTAAVISANNTLQTAVRAMKEDVQLIGCSSTTPNPYTTVASAILPADVTIVGDIMAKASTDASFKACKDLSAGQQDVQQITLQYYDPQAQLTQQVTVTKSIYDCADCASQQPVDFSVNMQDTANGPFGTTGTVEVVAGDTKSMPLRVLANNAPSWTPDLVWQTPSPKAGYINVVAVPDSVDTSVASLQVTAAVDTPPGTYKTTVRAFDLSSNTYSKLVNNNVYITVYPPITLAGISDTSDLDTLVGCGFTATTNGATTSACGPGFGTQLSLSGGYGNETIVAGIFGSYRIANTGTLKVGSTTFTCTAAKVCLSFDTTKTATGQQSLNIVVSGTKLSSYPASQALKTLYQANVRPTLAFGTQTNPIQVTCMKSAGTTTIGFLASTHDNYCGLTVTGAAGLGSKGTMTYASVSGPLVNYESDKVPKATYDSASDTASITYTVMGTGSNICSGKSAGSWSNSTKVGNVTDARQTSVTIPVWISVKC
jgi:Tfp pilus assembly protein PilV